MRFFVEVDLSGEYPYEVVHFKSGKLFCRVRDSVLAQGICEMLNYNTAKTKRDYALIFIFISLNALYKALRFILSPICPQSYQNFKDCF